jgi:hypothetical protein
MEWRGAQNQTLWRSNQTPQGNNLIAIVYVDLILAILGFWEMFPPW